MSGHAATPTTSSRMHARDFSGALGTNTTMGHGIEFQYGTMPAHHKEWIMKVCTGTSGWWFSWS